MSPHELRYGKKLRTLTDPREEPETSTQPLGTGRIYRRHVVNIRHHNGTPGVPEDTLHVGCHIAVRDTAGATEYRIAQVTALEENKIFVHICATTGKKLHRAKFRRVYADADDRLSFRRARGEEPFTMVIPIEMEEPLILMRVVLEKDSLTASSVTRLQDAYPGLQHRVEGKA